MALVYHRSGIALRRDGDPEPSLVRALQQDLRKLGATAVLHSGTTETLHPTQYHPSTTYKAVPDRSMLGCDWPYALRRYNGGGVNSYHDQYEALQRLTRPPLAT
jgi:hypothetical protein